MPHRSPPQHVLVVEDDAHAAEVLVAILSNAGYEAEWAANGRSALDRLACDPLPSLILLDLHMPAMDGWEFLAHQRESPRCVEIPVIVMSGDASTSAAAIDVNYFLRKPFTAVSLEHTVRNAFAALEREYRRAERMAHVDRLASLGTMAATLGHEINNPLTYVVSGIEHLGEELATLAKEVPEGRLTEALTNLDELRQGARRIADIVRSLRTTARGEWHGTTKIALPSLLSTAATIARGEITPRARLIQEHEETPLVEGDETRLTQVFVNLLVNAAQSIHRRDGGRSEIRVRTRTDAGGLAVVEVADTGCGIPSELRARVFDPFFTTKPVGTGTGLGLFISRGIVEAHGGTITFESEIGCGTTFRVTLPPVPPKVGRAAVAG
jgi:two-component system, NtrC family, sensor kinase